MYINNAGVNESKSSASAGHTAAGSVGGGLSKSFVRTLQGQMVGWIKAITDDKLTSNEISAIEQGASFDNLNSVDDPGLSDPLYSSTAAYFYASTKMSDVTNLITFLFNFESMKDQLYEKVQNAMRG